MARSHKNKNNHNSYNSNYSHYNPSAMSLPSLTRLVLPRLDLLRDVTSYEDRRTHYPDLIRPAFALPRAAARLVVKPVNKNVQRSKVKATYPGYGVKFAVPERVAMCVRRKRRAEVLHALKRTGKGSGGGRKRRTPYSSISC